MEKKEKDSVKKESDLEAIAWIVNRVVWSSLLAGIIMVVLLPVIFLFDLAGNEKSYEDEFNNQIRQLQVMKMNIERDLACRKSSLEKIKAIITDYNELHSDELSKVKFSYILKSNDIQIIDESRYIISPINFSIKFLSDDSSEDIYFMDHVNDSIHNLKEGKYEFKIDNLCSRDKFFQIVKR